MKLVREESKHLPQIDKVEKKKRQVVTDRKREIKANNYKLKEFQGIPSRVKPLLEHSSNDWGDLSDIKYSTTWWFGFNYELINI